MKLKMIEYFQGTGFPTLAEGQEYELEDNELGKWLVENHKAVVVREYKSKVLEAPVVEKVEEELENVMTSHDPDEPELEVVEESVEVTDEDFEEMMKSVPDEVVVEKEVEEKPVHRNRRKK